ncbi:MAG: hypothetical protein AAGH99_03345 [Planctomycetota bacterium]
MPQCSFLRTVMLTVAALCLWLGAADSGAQVGSALMAIPWQPGQTVNSINYYLGLQTESETVGVDTNLTRGVSLGRFRFDANDPQSLTVGWLFDHIEIDSLDPLLPGQLTNTAVAVGKNLGQITGDWNVAVSGGVGFAGDQPFGDEDGYYTLGSVLASKQLDRQTRLTLILDFDGSRAVLPDVPLPGIQYSVFVSPQLRYSLGLPFSTIFYQPDDRWTFDIQYALPLGGRADISYRIDDRLTAFAGYSATNRAFHIDGEENERIFFSQDRAELGLRFSPVPDQTWTVSGGWAFDQEFTTGFNSFDDGDLRELDDAAFLRLGLRFGF